MTPHLNDSSLVESKRAETASAETSPAADQTEFYFGYSRYAAPFLIRWMKRAGIGQPVDIVHFCLCQRLCRRILHHIQVIIIFFCQPAAGTGICILILGIKTLRVSLF